MPLATEYLDAYPIAETVLEIQRDEELFLTQPKVTFIKLLNHEPLKVVHFPTTYDQSQPFARPRGVYESDFLRVEWQQMNARQPFYHRNADVDELSFQVSGERTLMTEYGIVEHRPGEFSRIPVSVAHDNFGREDVHLLFYVPAPVKECVESASTGKLQIPPFEGWVSKPVSELITNCLGGPECDIAISTANETLLLQHAENVEESKRIQVLRPKREDGIQQWLYKSNHVWIGYMRRSPGRQPVQVYARHRVAEEIQCQVKGRRTIISQRGIVTLEEGDFVSIPLGVAFTDVVQEESEYISILTHKPTPQKAPTLREGLPTSWAAVQDLRM